MPTPISDPEVCTIITNALQMRVTENNQRQSQWKLQPQGVSTPHSMGLSSLTIDQSGHSDMTRLVFEMGRLLELYMWNRQPFMSASDFEMVSDATRRIAEALADALHWHLIKMYWNTTMQQNNFWSIALKARTKEILKEVC
jgi:hypothetical protein